MALSNEQKAAVKAAVQADPALAVAWARADNKPTGDVVNALNATDRSTDVSVPASRAAAVILMTGEWADIKLLAETRPATNSVKAAMTLVETLADRDRVIPAAAKASVSSKLDALVEAKALSRSSADAMLALFAGKTSRAQQLIGGSISEGDLLDAMK